MERRFTIELTEKEVDHIRKALALRTIAFEDKGDEKHADECDDLRYRFVDLLRKEV